jgi:hypothetical protein
MSSSPVPARTRRSRRLLLPAAAVMAALALAACGGDDENDTIDTDDTTTETPLPVDVDPGAEGGDTGGDDDASGDRIPGGVALDACVLLDPATVDTLLTTTGATASPDTSLGLADGCRYASADVDVPAVIVGYTDTIAFDEVRDLACDGADVVEVPTVAEGAVECFGAVVAPANGGAILVAIEDPTDLYDDVTDSALTATAALAVLGTLQTI